MVLQLPNNTLVLLLGNVLCRMSISCVEHSQLKMPPRRLFLGTRRIRNLASPRFAYDLFLENESNILALDKNFLRLIV